MQKMLAFVKNYGWSLFGLALFAAGMLAVFVSVLPKYIALLTPDSMPFFPWSYRTVVLERLLGGQQFTIHTLYWLVFNPLHAHELSFILDTLVLVVGGAYYLRSRRAHPLAAWAGGLALGLSGYTFTLFCAGHRGYFHMFSCAVWAFGLMARGFQTKSLFYFAALGLAFAWGVPYQPDVLLLVGGVAGAYALWLTAIEPSPSGGWGAATLKKAVSVWPRFGVSLLVLALAGFGGIRSAVTTQIANRDAQINGTAPRHDAAEKKPQAAGAAEKHDRWVFATNWSLPPEDILEFVVPGLFGNESMQGERPYWGRLGRPHDEVFQKGRMMPNYRQHTVYLGLVPVLFALLAVLAYVRGRRRKEPASPQEEGADLSDVPFWAGVWFVCLLLAAGRYLPLYRLFYAIPYMDYIRAPVKFLHLVEIATAFLAGFGADALMRAKGRELRRAMLAVCVGAAGALLVGLLVSAVAKPAMAREIAALGFGQLAPALSGYLQQNLVRAACLAAAAAGLAYVALRSASPRVQTAVVGVFAALLVADQVCVAKRYVKELDVESHYSENAVTRAIRKSAGDGQIPNVVNYATPNSEDRSWFSGSLVFNGIRNLMPTQEENGTGYGKLFMGLQGDPVRLWKLLNAQFVIVPRKAAEALVRGGVLRPLLEFEVGERRVTQGGAPGERTMVLASVNGSGLGARAFTRWVGGRGPAEQADEAGRQADPVSEAPAPDTSAASAPAPQLKTESVRGLPLSFETRLTCQSAAPALVVFNERYSDALEARVDGKPVRCFLTDGTWASAAVPAGTHSVALRKKRDVLPAALSFAVSLFLAGAGAWRLSRAARGR